MKTKANKKATKFPTLAALHRAQKAAEKEYGEKQPYKSSAIFWMIEAAICIDCGMNPRADIQRSMKRFKKHCEQFGLSI